MSKSIDFTVEYNGVGFTSTRTEVFKSKNVTRLLKSFPKHMKKKWINISWSENGVDKELTRAEYDHENK